VVHQALNLEARHRLRVRCESGEVRTFLWTPVASVPVLNNGVNTGMLPRSGAAFFRLRN
jgi:hypothetical protein